MLFRNRTSAALLLTGVLLAATALLQVLLEDIGTQYDARQYLLLAGGGALLLTALLPDNWRRTAALVLASTAFTLLAAELVLRLFFANLYASNYLYDNELLFHNTPGQEKLYRQLPENGAGFVTVRINAAGFRGPELRRTGATNRVIVYGDSFTLSSATPENETFPAQLEQLLSAGGVPDVEVLNGGVSGYGIDQNYLRMQRELAALEPALVVLAVYSGNDFGDAISNKLFRLADDGALARNAAVDPGWLRTGLRRDRHKPYLLKLYENARTALRKPQAGETGARNPGPHDRLERLLDARRNHYQQYVIENDNHVSMSILADFYDADVAMLPDSESARYKQRLFRALLAQIRRLCEQHDVPLALLIIPHPVDVVEGFNDMSVDRRKYPDYTPAGLSKIVHDMARELDIPAVNLFDELAGRDGRDYYLKGGDTHWNSAGQALAAEKMAELITSQQLLRATPSP